MLVMMRIDILFEEYVGEIGVGGCLYGDLFYGFDFDCKREED